MKTITFYSYKGGVGRTLTLVNIAKRLLEFNKKVCILDLDIEAPGIQFKFQDYIGNRKIENGIVDYIYDFSKNGILNENLDKYIFEINIGKNNFALIPSGNIDSEDYWMKLSSIDWYKLLYIKGEGIPFFIDLKERIKKQINPDYLLIDSRTGITEISSISLSILSDSVVVVASNNEENISGASRVINGLTNPNNFVNGKLPNIYFVLSRIPTNPEKPEDKQNELLLVNKIKDKLNTFLKSKGNNYEIKELSIIHSDRDLELKESFKIGYETDLQINPISLDYLQIFNRIIKLTPSERKKFNNIKESEKLVEKAKKNLNRTQAIEQLTEAISLNNENFDAYVWRGYNNYLEKKFNKSIEDFNKVLIKNPLRREALIWRGVAFRKIDQYEKALEDLDRARSYFGDEEQILIEIANVYSEKGDIVNAEKFYLLALEVNRNNAIICNNISNFYKKVGKLELALKYIYQSLTLNPKSAISYTTLAEINYFQNNMNEFYKNYEIALIFKVDNMEIEEEIEYKSLKDENRFIELLMKYNRNDLVDQLKKI
jgi:MinD-like ATPase involved in chromosome partitioning or flagellar assembly